MKKPVIFYALILGLYAIVISSCKDSVNSLPTEITGDYSVFAWNDLGMHCLNPTYDKLVILPPYNINNWQSIETKLSLIKYPVLTFKNYAL